MGQWWARCCAGGLATSAFEPGLASIAGVVCTYRNAAIDEDGCYNPADFNDGLLLGLKGDNGSSRAYYCAGASQASSIRRRKESMASLPWALF